MLNGAVSCYYCIHRCFCRCEVECVRNRLAVVIDNWGESVAYTFNYDPTATSVNTVVAADGTVKHIYTLTGAKVTSLQRGVNIVRTADGRTLKVLKK